MGAGIWDDVEAMEGEAFEDEEKNPYLTEPTRGLQLIARLLPKRKQYTESDKAAHHLDVLLDVRLVSTVRELGLKTLEFSQHLMKASDQIMEYQKMRLLSGKTVIGLGGQFSSGKSSFINSRLQTDGQTIILPEDQNPTTSIPTYIVGGSREEIYAYCGGAKVSLDKDAMQALTHEFYKEYGIGFSRFVSNIVIHTPALGGGLAHKIVFLDTPGYNKADMDTRETLKDEHLAAQQLKTVDFLVWLVDISNGVVQERDLEFFQKVPKDTPILIVFNKADKKTEEACSSIVEESRRILEERNIKVFGVSAYSSRDGREFLGKNLVHNFLAQAVQGAAQKRNMGQYLENLIQSIKDNFKEAMEEADNWKYGLGNDLFRAQDIFAIKSLAHLYSRAAQHKRRLLGDSKMFYQLSKQIQKSVWQLEH